MKLRNSIAPLKNVIQLKHFDKNSKEEITLWLNSILSDLTIKDFMRRVRYDIWWSIGKENRDKVIKASIPESEWVGGYADYNDAHLYTLLSKVLSASYLTKMFVHHGIDSGSFTERSSK